MDAVRLRDVYEFQTGGKRYLYQVDTGAIVGLDEIAAAAIACLRGGRDAAAQEVVARLKGRHEESSVQETLGELEALEIIGSQDLEDPWGTPPPLPFPLRTLVCNVAHGCNLRCAYCYADGGAYGGEPSLMSAATARRCVDFLLQSSGNNRRVGLVFFGGEPLLNPGAIRAAVEHGRREESRWDKEIDFSLTTNATLLTEEIVGFLDDHRVGVTVSLDGPPLVHDRARTFADGTGSYEAAAKGVRLLLQGPGSPPLAARVTVTRGVGNLEETFSHLRELGFAQVGFCPVATRDERHALSGDDLWSFLEQLCRLARLGLGEGKAGRPPALSNLTNLLQILHQGQRRIYPCGAGLGLLGVGPGGELYPCHRFSGSSELGLGCIDEGLEAERLARFFQRVGATKRPRECRQCWLRNLCGGGCYFESFVHFGDPFAPNLHYCRWLAEWIEEGLKLYAELAEHRAGIGDLEQAI